MPIREGEWCFRGVGGVEDGVDKLEVGGDEEWVGSRRWMRGEVELVRRDLK